MNEMNKNDSQKNILQNLSEAHRAFVRRENALAAHTRELAYIEAESALDDTAEDFELLLERLRPSFSELLELGNVTQGLWNGFDISFSEALCERLTAHDIEIPPFYGYDERLDESSLRIACFSNRAADEAYLEFARRLPGAEQVICDSILAACEEVSFGRCELCLLPVYSSADGIMPNVYRQTVKNGLFEVMCIDMPSSGDITVRYSLFSANPCRSEKADTLSLTFIGYSGSEASLIPSAVSKLGGKVEQINSLPPSVYGGNEAWEIKFSIGSADIRILHLFLQLRYPRFEVSGIYEKIECRNRRRGYGEENF